MLILLEGIDKAGKTTLGAKLSAEFGLPVYRKHITPDLSLQQYHYYFMGIGTALLELHNLFKYNVIVDRSFICDWVYSNRNGADNPIESWLKWEKLDVTGEVFICYVSISRDTLRRRLDLHPDEYMTDRDYESDISRYEEYLSRSRFRIVRVSGEIPYSTQAKEMADVISRMAARA
jgi:thymidylate kinase